jgi:hypothetical protein
MMTTTFGRTLGICAAAMLLAAGIAGAQTMYAQRANLQIFDQPDIAGAPIEIVERNALLTMVSANGRWTQVTTAAGNTGWVLTTALAQTAAEGGGDASGLFALTGATLDTASAGRGVARDGAIQYAASNSYDTSVLETMFAARERVRPQWRAFVTEGRLAGGAPMPAPAAAASAAGPQ